jgi:mono/diheme cytochrome c family protein
MKMFKFLATTLLISGLSLLLVSFIPQPKPGKPWQVPKEFKSMKNPQKSDAESLKIGKAEYNKSCKSCHGMKGLGDGPKAKTLKTSSGDFSKDFKGQSDSDLFYKTKFGRDEMPGYEKKISDEDLWHLVNYMRTLEAK